MSGSSPGFIEPHFFAGFSGGPKALMPGVAHLETVMSNHGVDHLNDPRSTFGICEGNPLWEELLEIALRVGPSFLLNVTLNEHRDITRVFAGDLVEAHRVGASTSAPLRCRRWIVRSKSWSPRTRAIRST
jgi:nickel-dependent lactate racemase